MTTHRQLHPFILSALFMLIVTASFGQSQSTQNNDQTRAFQQADKALNSTYQKLLKQYSSDTEFINNLKTAQRIWVQFREAEVKMKYPNRPKGYYGSAQPYCEASYRTELTEQRTKTLTVWLTGIEEGDVCAGSVKTKEL